MLIVTRLVASLGVVRREVLELPLLHPALVIVEFLIVLPIALAS